LQRDPTLPNNPPHLDEHVSAAPDISPGIVADDEYLLRELFNPQHIDDGGQVLVTAISLKDLRHRGFSVNRIRYVSRDFIKSSVGERLSRPRHGRPWRDEGVAKFATRQIRQIQTQGEQAFVVIDTALPENPGHASIYVTKPQMGEAYARELRKLLLPLLQDRMSIEQAFNSFRLY